MVLPIFVLVVLAGLQFGWAQHASGSVNFALEQSSRALLLNPTLDESAVRAMVLGKLDPGTAANVTVSVSRFTSAGAPAARVTGVYRQTIGLPGLAAMPFNFTRIVVTPLPASP
jgi:Flp pilus assembly protein TadG